ncbi:hypothetical protein DXG01_012104 [Tephrocybe rancida]|nr:hypothetical protein DXG01_012104 [Tephrocybe rancida]
MAFVKRLFFNPASWECINEGHKLYAKFLATQTAAADIPFIVGGATALRVHDVLHRNSEDFDGYISKGTLSAFDTALKPFLNSELNQQLLIRGATQEIRDAKTKCTVFWRAIDLKRKRGDEDMNIKADISENQEIFASSNMSIEVGGIRVATVQTLAIYKICAIARKNRTNSTKKDIGDLLACFNYLEINELVFAEDVQGLLRLEPSFSWVDFWKAVDTSDQQFWAGYILKQLQERGIKGCEPYSFDTAAAR